MLITITKHISGEACFAVAVIEDSDNSVTIPILATGQPITSDYVTQLHKAISSDGCTAVPDFYKECCIIHDLAYRYKMSPWGTPMTKADADNGFRTCIQSRSKLGRCSPLSWVRYFGVAVFGKRAWKHATVHFVN